MIATNFRRYPEALALQLCLDFGALVRWATSRPGCRVLRVIRAARAKAAAAMPFVAPWLPPLTVEPDATAPAWVKDRARAARELAATLRGQQLPAFREVKGFGPHPRRKDRRGPPCWQLLGFDYAAN